MVNKRMKPETAKQFVTKVARRKGYAVEELPKRGKGSHRVCKIVDQDGKEVGRFGLTGHPKEMSWTMMHQIEDRLAEVFGDPKWMEKK